MRVLLVTWEPVVTPRVPTWPRLATAARALAAAGDRVTVVADAPTLERADLAGHVTTVVAHEAAPFLDLADARTMALAGGLALQSAAHPLAREAEVVHAVGWTATHGAVHLARLAERPLVTTLLTLPTARTTAEDALVFAHQTRWWASYEAQVVVTPSARLRRRVLAAYRPPDDAVVTAPFPRGATSPVDPVALAAALQDAHARAAALVAGRGEPAASVPAGLRLA